MFYFQEQQDIFFNDALESNEKCLKKEVCPKPENCPNTNEIYQTFANNYKKYRSEFNLNKQRIIIDEEMYGISSAEVDANGDLYLEIISESLRARYGEKYKVLGNVLKFDVYDYGNGYGKVLIAIIEDGTLAEINLLNAINESKIEAKIRSEYQNIVDVKNILN